MTEFLDVMNNKNNPLGIIKSRKEIHKDGDWHKASHVWILNEKNQILCQKRSHNKEWFPDRWDMTFGGHVRAGESYESAAITELSEELGISVKVNDLEFLMDFVIDKKDVRKWTLNREFLKVYFLRTKKAVSEFKIQKTEISEMRYFDIIKLKTLLNKRSEIKFIPENEYYLLVLNKIQSIKQ